MATVVAFSTHALEEKEKKARSENWLVEDAPEQKRLERRREEKKFSSMYIAIM